MCIITSDQLLQYIAAKLLLHFPISDAAIQQRHNIIPVPAQRPGSVSGIIRDWTESARAKKTHFPTFERTLFHHPTRTIGCSFMSVRPLPTFCWVGYGQNVILELFVN